jgi:PAS domain S-box-containing protein
VAHPGAATLLPKKSIMALIRHLARLEPVSVEPTAPAAAERENLPALSQHNLDALGLPLAYVDRNRRYRFVNKAFLDWTDKRYDDVIGHEVVEVVGREVFELYAAYVDAALDGERTGYERQLAARGRPAIWIRVDYYPDRSAAGPVRGFLVTYTDVDPLKRLELEAGQREHRLRIVTDSVGSPIIYFDQQLKLRFANQPFGDWIGVAADDLLGHSLTELLHADTFAEMQGYIERAFAGAKVSYERRDRNAKGELRWIRTTLFPDRAVGGRVGGVFAVMTDIDDDVQIRNALKAQEGQLRLFADNIPGPIAYLDRNLRYRFVNQAFANWVCRPQDEIYGRTPSEVLTYDVAAFLQPILRRAQEGQNVEYERIGATQDGQRRWMHGRIVPDLEASGTVRGVYCTEYDIHDLKLTEQALATREEQLRLFTDNIPEPVVYLDADRRYAFVNEAFLALVGLARDGCSASYRSAGTGPRGMMEPGRNRVFAGRRSLRARHRRQQAQRWIRALRTGPQLRRHGEGRVRRRPRHHRPEAGAGHPGHARRPADRDHQRRARAGRVHRPRRALPLREPRVPAVLRADAGAGQRDAAA